MLLLHTPSSILFANFTTKLKYMWDQLANMFVEWGQFLKIFTTVFCKRFVLSIDFRMAPPLLLQVGASLL